MKKLTPSQTKKYDINQKIIHELTNLESRLVLFSITKQARTGAEISSKIKVPLSTVYQKLHSLEELSLIFVERIDGSESAAKNAKHYRSRIKGVDILISKQEPKLILIKNKF